MLNAERRTNTACLNNVHKLFREISGSRSCAQASDWVDWPIGKRFQADKSNVTDQMPVKPRQLLCRQLSLCDLFVAPELPDAWIYHDLGHVQCHQNMIAEAHAATGQLAYARYACYAPNRTSRLRATIKPANNRRSHYCKRLITKSPLVFHTCCGPVHGMFSILQAVASAAKGVSAVGTAIQLTRPAAEPTYYVYTSHQTSCTLCGQCAPMHQQSQ